MTLYRQLLLFSLITLICLCAGLWLGDHKRTREFLVDQMASHAQDTATSLGLTLSTLAKGTDIAAMEAMVNALFDRGYYQHIRVVDVQGQVLIDRHSELVVSGVPAWFIHLTPLTGPQADALIMHGWQQTGSVWVQSHPGYAYRTLWHSALTAAFWFGVVAVAVALLGSLGLRRLLRPLAEVEIQAQALCDRRFHIQTVLPRTRELRRVVMAMNRTTERLREMFDEQAAIADGLRQNAYQDPMTGLGNRRFFEAQVKTKLEETGQGTRGVLLLFQIHDLQAINLAHGYAAGDRLIEATAASLRGACSHLPEAILARLSGGDMALLLPNADMATAAGLAAGVCETLQTEGEMQPDGGTQTVSCGGVAYEQPIDLGELLTRADSALAAACYQNDGKPMVLPAAVATEEKPVGKTEWKPLLEEIIANRSIVLYAQPTVSRADRQEVVQLEILTRVIDRGDRHRSAEIFLPAVEQLGLAAAFDRMILECLFSLPPSVLARHRLTINLSPISLTDTAFAAWALERLHQCAANGLSLQVEFPEFRAMRHLQAIKSFAEAIRPLGHGLGIDHFGQGLTRFGYLKSLLPDYVKIDRAIINELHDDQSDSHFLVSSLCAAAHSLDIRVIVEGVETERQWQTVTTLPIDAVQGFYLGHPEPLHH